MYPQPSDPPPELREERHRASNNPPKKCPQKKSPTLFQKGVFKRIPSHVKCWVIAVLIVGSLAYWNYSQPRSFAYEINPVTLEVRAVNYIRRPITGVAQLKVRGQEQMAIGRWLIENGYLVSDSPGYWVNVKSYNTRDRFQKGPGRALQQNFDCARVAAPMSYPSVESENQEWVDWCNHNPKRAKLVWRAYSELVVDPDNVRQAAYLLSVALEPPREWYDNEAFESAIRHMLNE